jgi:hypothetical protein
LPLSPIVGEGIGEYLALDFEDKRTRGEIFRREDGTVVENFTFSDDFVIYEYAKCACS